MQRSDEPGGSASRWGPLFGARAHDWAETWEGPGGYGTPVYEHVLERTGVGSSTRLLDCGCGAGRFARMAADRGASVAGIDAAAGLIEIAADRTPEGDFRVGDLEALPWPDASFDVVTGFNAFQFADDKARALTETRRVSHGQIAVVIPSRAADSGLTHVYKPLLPLYPAEALQSLKHSGIYALSAPGTLEDTLTAAGLSARDDQEVETPIAFDDVDVAIRAFLGAGPTQIAIGHSGEEAVTHAVQEGLGRFTGADGHVTLPGWYRVVIAQA